MTTKPDNLSFKEFMQKALAKCDPPVTLTKMQIDVMESILHGKKIVIDYHNSRLRMAMFEEDMARRLVFAILNKKPIKFITKDEEAAKRIARRVKEMLEGL